MTHSEDRADWLLLRQQGAERGEAGRAWKKARQEDSQGPEAITANAPSFEPWPSSESGRSVRN